MEIAVLASGGVDSAVAALLASEGGVKPTLFYIVIGSHEESEFNCTMEEDVEMVNLLAKKLSLRVEIVDLHKDYWENVVEYIVSSVKKGLTPNPDVMCNSLIKFGCFYERIGKHIDKTVTGHYATTVVLNGRKHLSTAVDATKDQTDFLCQITPEQLSKLEFPIGNLMKAEVRAIARENHLAPADRPDSQGICFLVDTTYNELLRHYLGERGGDIVEWETRKKIGRHRGYWFYTIGQRKGLGLGGGPWFVVAKDTRKNWVYVSREADCNERRSESILLPEFHSISGMKPPTDVPVLFKIRHSPDFLTGKLKREEDGYILQPEEPLTGVAPGQFAVIYVPYDKTHKICVGSSPIGHTLSGQASR